MGNYLINMNKSPIESKDLNVNFLWNKDNIFISDNHRVALWCWFQKINNNENFKIIHIDRHYDAAPLPSLAELFEPPPNLKRINIYEYLNYEFYHKTHRVITYSFKWANFLSAFKLYYYKEENEILLFTHKCGGLLPIMEQHFADTAKLNETLEDEKNQVHMRTIIDLDLDFFYKPLNGDLSVELIEESEINKTINLLKELKNKKNDTIFTIATSPDCCKNLPDPFWLGWNNSRILLRKLCEILNLDFDIPHLTDPDFSR